MRVDTFCSCPASSQLAADLSWVVSAHPSPSLLTIRTSLSVHRPAPAGSDPPPRPLPFQMPTSEADETSWSVDELSEGEFDARATFLVRDSPVAEGVQDRARASQPNNVSTKDGVCGNSDVLDSSA